MEALTRRQMDVLNFVATTRQSRGVAPTLKEIGDAFGVGIGRAQKYVAALVRKGYATSEAGRHRGLRLTTGRRAWKVRRVWQGEFEERVGSKLQSETELGRVFEIVRGELRSWLDVDRAELLVYDPQGRALRPGAYYEGPPREAGQAPAEGEDGDTLALQALRRRKPVVEAQGRKALHQSMSPSAADGASGDMHGAGQALYQSSSASAPEGAPADKHGTEQAA